MTKRPRSTTTVPFHLGVLGLALLRDWRIVDEAHVDSALAEIKRVLDHSATQPGAFALTVRHFGVADGYVAWSESYDLGTNWLIAAEEGPLTEILARGPAGNALDAACGTGRIARRLIDLGHRVTGVDQSDAMLERARRNAPEAIFMTGSIERIPSADAAFDLVTCALALTHHESLTPAVNELARVVRPGGRIVLSDIHPFSCFLGGHAAFALGENERGLIVNHRHDHGTYLRAFADAGLEVRDCVEPALDEAIIEQMLLRRLRQVAAPEVYAAYARGLMGLPAALIWELAKR